MAEHPYAMRWCETHSSPLGLCIGTGEKCRIVWGRFVPDDPGPTIASLANDPKARD